MVDIKFYFSEDNIISIINKENIHAKNAKNNSFLFFMNKIGGMIEYKTQTISYRKRV